MNTPGGTSQDTFSFYTQRCNQRGRWQQSLLHLEIPFADLARLDLPTMHLKHLQVYGLSTRLSFELKWTRVVNYKGGRKGESLPADLHTEHLNKACKTARAGLGANVQLNACKQQ